MARKCLQIKEETLNSQEPEWIMKVGQGILFSRKYLQSVGGGGGKGVAVPRWHFARCVCVQSPQPPCSFRVTNELDVGVNGLRG